jgi:Na+/proline symporter
MKKNIQVISKYSLLRKELRNQYNRKRVIIISLICAILFGIMGLFAIKVIPQPQEDQVIVILLFVALGLFVPPIVLIGWQNMTQSDYEEQLINNGIFYMKKNKWKKIDMDVIEKRAEIGSSAVTGRTVLVLLVPSFLIASFGKGVPASLELIMTILIILFSFLYLVELDRANLDIIIRQLCVTYKHISIKK